MAKVKTKPAFFRAGGVDQVVLRSGADIAGIVDLDQKLWVALACPAKGVELDAKLLALIDTDSDGRVRPPDVKAAVEWCTSVFKSLDLFLEKGETVPLSSLDGSTELGKPVLAGAKRILKDRGKKEEKAISLEDVLAMEEIFAGTRLNGDGIVPAESATTDEERSAIADVIAALGSTTDRSGKPGVDAKRVTDFFEQAREVVAWDDSGNTGDVAVLGGASAAAAAAVSAVAEKVDDYFTRCRIAAFDARGAAQLGASEAELAALSPKSLSATSEDLAKLPIARVEAGRPLPLEGATNPAWTERLARLAESAVLPVLGPLGALSEADWRALRAKVDPYRSWLAKKPGTPVATVSPARLRALIDAKMDARLLELVAEDAALESEYAALANVEKAVRFRIGLVRLLRNFVSFADFYGGRPAIFQAGTLYLDGRSCELVIYVADAAKHAKVAGLSSAYLVYCDIVRGTEKKGIVAAFTAGDTDNLMVGRNGVFYDRSGKDWDATITSLVENPISIQQAFWTPYKRLVRLIEDQVAKRAAEKEKASRASIDAMAAQAANADQGTPPPAPAAPAAPVPATVPTEPKKVDVGMVAAIGVAVAGVATFASSVLATFLGLGMWMPLGILALVFAISGPSMLVAWLKLRRRNLGPILDANGWAVNTLTVINVPFGTSLTHLRKLPPGASRTLDDPFAETRTPWKLYVAMVVVAALGIAWLLGALDNYLPDAVRSSAVLHRTPR